MYIRKTKDEWAVQGLYVSEWEDLTTEETKKEAYIQLKCYNENEKMPHRIIKRRIPK